MKRSVKVALVAMATVLAILATACGSGRNDAQDQPSGPGTTTAAEGDSFGDLASPCGPAPEGEANTASAQGVTADSIAIGYGDDAGYQAAPGTNHEVSDAMRAIVKWCNEQGGINGRKVDATYYDAKITEAVNAVTEACPKEFFLVGQMFSLDSAQEQARRGCGLPSVPATAVSPQFANAPLMVNPTPNPVDYYVAGATAQLAELFPEKVEKAAVIYANYAATRDSKDKFVLGATANGWTFLDCPQEYSIQGEADWKPFAQKLKDCGAEVVYFAGSPVPNWQNLLDAAHQIGFEPIWTSEANAYSEAFIKWNASGNANNVYFPINFIPFEEADTNPVTQQYIDLVRAEGGDISSLGLRATSGFLLWATAAEECGANLTRECVLDKLAAVHEWTGGGLHAETDPGGNIPFHCDVLVKLEGQTVVRVAPTDPGTYGCEEDFALPITGSVVENAKLDANRIAQI